MYSVVSLDVPVEYNLEDKACNCANPASGNTYHEYTWFVAAGADCCDEVTDPTGQDITFTLNEGVWEETSRESISGVSAQEKAACC